MFATIQTSGMLSVFVFFVVWVLIGKFVLLSLFLAVILEVCSHLSIVTAEAVCFLFHCGAQRELHRSQSQSCIMSAGI